MQYNNIKKVAHYHTLSNEEYSFCIGQSDKCFYAIIIKANNMFCEKAMSVAIAKQILLNHLYRYIHRDAQTDKSKVEQIELVKKIKTSEIVDFIY